eukprot:GHVS01005245.1.p1 GENE.GHVS01005245.1~~GHVS01005245.1.p1  ORF type:complete len:115 (+),score=3.08 GHVS01005245.1:177-521(+)
MLYVTVRYNNMVSATGPPLAGFAYGVVVHQTRPLTHRPFQALRIRQSLLFLKYRMVMTESTNTRHSTNLMSICGVVTTATIGRPNPNNIARYIQRGVSDVHAATVELTAKTRYT